MSGYGFMPPGGGGGLGAGEGYGYGFGMQQQPNPMAFGGIGFAQVLPQQQQLQQQQQAGGGADDVRTIFISGFPSDVKERELNNLLRFVGGYEASQMNFKNGEVCWGGGGAACGDRCRFASVCRPPTTTHCLL